MAQTKSFLPQKGNYKGLVAYKKAECIYDITYHFAHRFLERSDRTIDQMIQAARSDETIANIAITLIHQEDYLLYRLIQRSQQDFLEKGGIKEKMYSARKQEKHI
jgi:four helix bundle suffix protein